MFGDAYSDARVLVTGHTGFKGSWLCEWLLGLGAKVYGVALDPPSDPSLYHQLDLVTRIERDHRIDIRDGKALSDAVAKTNPDFVFHLAAQPLVRTSYEKPVETMEINVLGTLLLLEAIKKAGIPCATVIATTDKVYVNRERAEGYSEEEPLGGHDPYSASKAAVEIVADSWRKSFGLTGGSEGTLATARAGNVIGGGDWALDRIIPDCMRALKAGKEIEVRNSSATRPWQHVLEPLSGYLWLGTLLKRAKLVDLATKDVCSAFNFGPNDESNQNVQSLVTEVLRHWPGTWKDTSDAKAPHEAGLLHLSIRKAHELLRWEPVWNFQETVEATVSWYRESTSPNGSNPSSLCQDQIESYTAAARAKSIAWAE
ncbi:MAG: CDP-glucose 4,6-dehydratase [Verrucomicrobiota bacterium]